MTIWVAVILIMAGYAIGFYFQNRQLTEFKEGLDRYLAKKFQDIDLRFTSTHNRLHQIEERLSAIEKRMPL